MSVKTKSLLSITIGLASLVIVLALASMSPAPFPVVEAASDLRSINPADNQAPTDLSGQLVISGSTTVQPLAEELARHL